MSGPSILEIADVSAGYGARRILERTTLAPIRSGAFVALIGPNGAGKSTLLKAIAGIVPSTGRIALDGQDLREAPALRARRVAFMPQLSAQGASLSVFESVVTSAVVGLGANTATARAKAAAVLERLGIAALALDRLAALSGGQRQLVSFAQSLVREPSVLLLDEPTSALDLKHQLRVLGLARDAAKAGRIVVAVLHDLTLAAQFADRVAVLHGGAVAADGPPAEAITAEMLRSVYGVVARIDRTSDGLPRIVAETEWTG